MIKTHLLLIFRSFKRNLTYSLINIVGFAISLACCFVICLYVKTEFSYDTFHTQANHIFRYIPKGVDNAESTLQTWTPAGLAPFLLSEFPHDIKNVTRFAEWDKNPAIKLEDENISIGSLILADSSFFDIFSFPLIKGEPANVLSRPLTIVISEQVAQTYFPGQNPVGKTLRYNGKHDLEITGVFQNVPLNSHLQFSTITSITSTPEFMKEMGATKDEILNGFGAWFYATYALVETNDITALQNTISKRFHERHSMGDKNVSQPTDWLQPLTEIYFTKGIKGDGKTGTISYIYIAISLGVIILIVACFNFMNISTAIAIQRAKEVGLRKTLGAFRKQLIIQFLSEAFVQVVFSLIVAFFFLQLFLPIVQELFGIRFMKLDLSEYMLFFVVFISLTTLLAGGYPAFYLSSFKPAVTLKGGFSDNRKSFLQKTIITFQFSVSIFLLICTWVVFTQLHYMKNTDLGFNKDYIIHANADWDIKIQYESMKAAMLKHPEIKNVTMSGSQISNLQVYSFYNFPNGETTETHRIVSLSVEENYFDFMQIKLKEGRFLSKLYSTDKTNAIVVNEAFVREYGFKNPLGTVLQAVSVKGDNLNKVEIVGVVNDFYFQPLHNQVSPIIFKMDDNYWTVSIKFSPEGVNQGLVLTEEAWKKISEKPFDYTFLDEEIAKNYASEQRAISFLSVLTGFAILIAGLGLLGLTSIMTVQRRKEIGIRKVLGSTTSQIISLFSKDIIQLLMIAFLIAAPLGWFASQRWLENFFNRISANPLILVASGLMVAVFALLITGFQSARAAEENPTDSLKN